MMGRAFSADLRQRVIDAIESGMSTRATARRFSIGESTAGAWHRRWRQTGEAAARKQGQPGGSKLDAHEAFILGLIEADKDIALKEIGGRLEEAFGVKACPATIWYWLNRRGFTFKKRPPMRASRTATM
jgi:transposase